MFLNTCDPNSLYACNIINLTIYTIPEFGQKDLAITSLLFAKMSTNILSALKYVPNDFFKLCAIIFFIHLFHYFPFISI